MTILLVLPVPSSVLMIRRRVTPWVNTESSPRRLPVLLLEVLMANTIISPVLALLKDLYLTLRLRTVTVMLPWAIALSWLRGTVTRPLTLAVFLLLCPRSVLRKLLMEEMHFRLNKCLVSAWNILLPALVPMLARTAP